MYYGADTYYKLVCVELDNSKYAQLKVLEPCSKESKSWACSDWIYSELCLPGRSRERIVVAWAGSS